MISTQILIIFILLILNGFFALSEMAIVSASKPLLRQLAKKGDKRAQAALDLAEDSGRFLSTIQVGITLVGILAGAYGGAEIADKLGPILNEMPLFSPHGDIIAVVLVVAALTYFSVVIGELVPKQIALSKPESLAMFVARPMRLLSRILAPIVIILEWSAAVFFKMFGITQQTENVTETEVKAILAEGAASGAIEKSEHDMLQRIIRLGDRDVTSIMTHRTDITFIDMKDSQATIRKKITAAGHSRYPVIEGDASKIRGIVQTKDMLTDALGPGKTIQLAKFLRQVPVFPESTSCLRALEIFKFSPVHLAVVIDEYGAASGIITAADIFEAIVGIVPSNYDADDDPQITQRDDGSWLVDGTTSMEEIHLVIGVEEGEQSGDFDTIAGFILYHLGRRPDVGEYFDKGDYRFEVIDLDGQRIDKILICKIHPLES